MNLSLLHDSAVSVRLYDPATQQHYTGAGWTTTPASAQVVALTADDVDDPDYTRYSGTTGSWPVGDYLVEYLEDSTGSVINEERIIIPGLTAQEVWEYVTRTLTSAGSSGATAQEVWEYATRDLTVKTGFSLVTDYDPAKTAASQTSVNAAIAYIDTEITTIITHLTEIKGAGWTNENLTTIDSLVDTLVARLTATRAGYLDKLNITGSVSSSGDVTGVPAAVWAYEL